VWPRWCPIVVSIVACGSPDAPAPVTVPVAVGSCPEPSPAESSDGGVAQRVDEAIQRCSPLDPLEIVRDFDLQVSGRWSGEYQYLSGGRLTKAPFDATIEVANGRLVGTTSEPSTYGDPSSPNVEAVLAGEVRATREIVFLKAYSRGVVEHSVLYTGALSADGSEIAGRWLLPKIQGEFSMRRVDFSAAPEEMPESGWGTADQRVRRSGNPRRAR
jgi:hypothetical protein